MSTGAQKYGDRLAREVSERFLGTYANEAEMVAQPKERVAHLGVCVTLDGPKVWVFDQTSSATPSSTVLALTDGPGRFIKTT